MTLFNRLPGFSRTPAGMERVVLQRRPTTPRYGPREADQPDDR